MNRADEPSSIPPPAETGVSITGPHASTVPEPYRNDLESVLISADQIRERVTQLARQIEHDFAGREMLVVAVLTGTVIFLADLLRSLTLPLRLDFVGVSSYRGGTESGPLHFTKHLELEAKERDLLLVDDILDTGRTLAEVIQRMRRLEPRALRVCVLLRKRREPIKPVRADYVGFEIPDRFVVGYGLDYAERYRNLPFIGTLRQTELQSKSL